MLRLFDWFRDQSEKKNKTKTKTTTTTTKNHCVQNNVPSYQPHTLGLLYVQTDVTEKTLTNSRSRADNISQSRASSRHFESMNYEYTNKRTETRLTGIISIFSSILLPLASPLYLCLWTPQRNRNLPVSSGRHFECWEDPVHEGCSRACWLTLARVTVLRLHTVTMRGISNLHSKSGKVVKVFEQWTNVPSDIKISSWFCSFLSQVLLSVAPIVLDVAANHKIL